MPSASSATTCIRTRAPGLPGPDLAARRPPRPPVRAHGPQRRARRHAGDLHAPTMATSSATTGWARRSCSTTPCSSVPFIVADPRAAADATRGTVDAALRRVRSTWCRRCSTRWASPRRRTGSKARSLLPLLHGEHAAPWRDFVYSELDYSFRGARLTLGRTPQHAAPSACAPNAGATCTGWTSPSSCSTCAPTPRSSTTSAATLAPRPCAPALRDRLLDFLARRRHRTTVSDESVERATGAYKKAGVFFGQW